jgi:hypothetical protein
MVLITVVTGAYKPTYNWGASHCRCKSTHVLQGQILPTWLDTKSTLNGCDFGCNFHRPTSGKNNYIYVKRLFIYIYIYNLYIYNI